MEIDVKYKLFQSVWRLHENKPTNFQLKALKIQCSYAGYGGGYWGDETAGKGRGWPITVYYNTDEHAQHPWIPQDLIFETKEALLASL